jgi:hypothetical protein
VDTDAKLQPLAAALDALTPPPAHPALVFLVESLRARHGACVAAVLFYGSCLRNGNPFDGLVDLYLVVDNYRCANNGRLKAMWNRLLPPNVFYAEFPYEGAVLRCKYAVLSRRDLHRGTSKRWFHSYLWGRFSQPAAIAWARDDSLRLEVAGCLAQAVHTFLERTLPCAAPDGDIQSLWGEALRLSYHAEMRPESGGDRARELVKFNRDWYRRVTAAVTPALGWPLALAANDAYRVQISAAQRRRCRIAWKLRTLQGKLLSIARLLKALFTFDGGLDYAAWKLERHSGQHIEVPERVRRYPLIFVWGLFWDLYRRGIFR